MFSNELVRVEFNTKDNNEADAGSVGMLGRAGMELESRINPLVVIAIIAILIGMLVP